MAAPNMQAIALAAQQRALARQSISQPPTPSNSASSSASATTGAAPTNFGVVLRSTGVSIASPTPGGHHRVQTAFQHALSSPTASTRQSIFVNNSTPPATAPHTPISSSPSVPVTPTPVPSPPSSATSTPSTLSTTVASQPTAIINTSTPAPTPASTSTATLTIAPSSSSAFTPRPPSGSPPSSILRASPSVDDYQPPAGLKLSIDTNAEPEVSGVPIIAIPTPPPSSGRSRRKPPPLPVGFNASLLSPQGSNPQQTSPQPVSLTSPLPFPKAGVHDKAQLDKWADMLRNAMKPQDRKKHFQTYKECWIGKDAVQWLFHRSLDTGVKSEKEALLVCHELLHMHYISRVHSDNKKTDLSAAGSNAYRACFIPAKFYRFAAKSVPRHMAAPSISLNQALSAALSTIPSTASSSNGAPQQGPPPSPPQLTTSVSAPSGLTINTSKEHRGSITGGVTDIPWYSGWSGWLEKKRMKTVRVYQRRYFSLNLQDHALCYYMTNEEPFPIGFIPLNEVLTVTYLPQKGNGNRFDVVIPNRVFSLRAGNKEEATQWVAAISQAVARQKAALLPKKAAAPRTPKTPGTLKGFWRGRLPEAETMSTLRTQFFQINFSVASLSRPDFFQRLLNDFPNDAAIMQCIYDVILNPLDGGGALLDPILSPTSALAAAAATTTATTSSSTASRNSGGTTPRLESVRSEPTYESKSSVGRFSSPSPSPPSGDKPKSSPTAHRRASSDMPVSALVTATSSNGTDRSHRRRNSDVSLVTLRRAINRNERNQRYELFKAVSNKGRDDESSPLTVRERILQWVFSDAFVSMFDTEESLLSRYTLPLLWARTQAMHHRGLDDHEERRHSIHAMRKMSTASTGSVATSASCGYSSDDSSSLLSPSGGNSAPGSRWGSKRSSANIGGTPFGSLPLSDTHQLLVPQGLAMHLSPPSPSLAPSTPPASALSPLFHATAGSPPPPLLPMAPSLPSAVTALGSPPVGATAVPTSTTGRPASPKGSSSSSPFGTPQASRRSSGITTAATTSGTANVSTAAAASAYRCPSPLILNGVGISATGVNVGMGMISPLMAAMNAAAVCDPFVAHWKKGQGQSCEQCSAAIHEMAGFILHRFAGQRMNVVVSNALLGMLVTPIQQLLSVDITSDDFGVFNREVVTADLWKAIFVCLTGASLHVRRHALKDINGLLVTATTGAINCESLLTQPGWQKWILPLFDDTSPPDPNDRLQEKVFQYSINILSMVHYYTWLQLPSEEIRAMLPATLALAAQSAAEDSLVVSRTLLTTLVTRLGATKPQLLNGKWADIEWFFSQVKAFIFSSPRPPVKTPRHQRHRLAPVPEKKDMKAVPLTHLPQSASNVDELLLSLANIHWKEAGGLVADRELMDKCLATLKTLKIYYDISDGFGFSAAKQRELKEQTKRNNPKANDLAGDWALLSDEDADAVKKLQADVSFMKDAVVFLSLMTSRAHLLDEDQLRSLVRQFLTADKREKVFSSKLLASAATPASPIPPSSSFGHR